MVTNWRNPARAMLVVGLLSAIGGPSAASEPAKATPFSLPTVDGAQTVSLSQHAGKVVLLSFWATWCAPCKAEMPHLDTLARAKADAGLVVLSINADDARSARRVAPWVAQQDLALVWLMDTERTVLDAYDPSRTLPWSVLIGRDGTVLGTWSGFDEAGFAALRSAVDAALAAAPSTVSPSTPTPSD